MKRWGSISRPVFTPPEEPGAGRTGRLPEKHMVRPTTAPHPDHTGCPSPGQPGRRIPNGRTDRVSRAASHHSINRPDPRRSRPAQEDRGSVPPSRCPDQWPHPTALSFQRQRKANDVPLQSTAPRSAITVGTTSESGTSHEDVHHRAPSASRKTAATVVDGGRRLFRTLRPPIHHRPSPQTHS